MTLQIVSRDAFKDSLSQARARVGGLGGGLARAVAAQLEHMARATADEREPADDERTSINLGPLAAREIEESDPDYAQQLEELDYTFRRYPQLPAGPPVRRRGILQAWTGREAFAKTILEPGPARTVGTADADHVVHPERGGGPQFSVVWDGLAAHVLSVEPHEITINGLPAWLGELHNGGWMTADETTFRFFVEDRTPPPAPVTPTPAAVAATAELRRRCDHGGLYAVIDAARSERAMRLLAESVDAYASLYDGEQGRANDAVAPYLVQLRRDSQLLERLTGEGWGDAWGIWLTSRADFAGVRRHLRKFLTVEAEGDERRLLFRFYDPRVLRTFLPLATPAQRTALMGELDELMFEREDAALHVLRRDGSG